jgi:hypothetical protein
VFGYAYVQIDEKNDREAALARWNPTEENKDPSDQIQGVLKKEYEAGKHVTADQRVAYDITPPIGGPHDGVWAVCSGVVYETAVRTENMVHGLEHGAVWIAYNPDQVSGDALETLKKKVDGQPYTVMSPYPNLDSPVSLQSWGHQLKVGAATDPRIDEFIQALRRNQYTHPEVGASCDSSPGLFDQDNPPPFVPAPPVGAPGAEPEVSQNATAVAPDMSTAPR